MAYSHICSPQAHIIFKYYSSVNTIVEFEAHSTKAESIRGTYESLIFSSAFDLAIYSVFIAQFECPIFAVFLFFPFFSFWPIQSPSIFVLLPPLYSSPPKMYSSSFIVVFIGNFFLSIFLITSIALTLKTIIRIFFFLMLTLPLCRDYSKKEDIQKSWRSGINKILIYDSGRNL